MRNPTGRLVDSGQEDNADALPLIVVVGLPRSGTTWLAKILDSHPSTFYCHEPDRADALRGVPFAPNPAECERYADVVRRFALQLPSNRDIRVVGTRPVFPKDHSWPGSCLFRRAAIYGGKLIGSFGPELRVPLALPMVASRVVVWKSVESTARLGLLARALPNARFVHLIRHPCGFVDSQLRAYAGRHADSSTPPWSDVGIIEMLAKTGPARRIERRVGSLLRRSECERLAWLWLVQNEKAAEDTKSLPNVVSARYEDICEQPVAACCDLFAKLGLDWRRETQDFIAKSTRVHDSSYYALRKHPDLAAHGWRRRLNPQIVREVIEMVSSVACYPISAAEGAAAEPLGEAVAV